MVDEALGHHATRREGDSTRLPRADGAHRRAGPVNVQLRRYQFRNIGFRNSLLLPLVRSQLTPTVQPLVRHPKSTACVGGEFPTTGKETSFVDVMGTAPFGTEHPTRHDLLNTAGFEKERSDIRVGLNQLAPPAVASGLFAGLERKLGSFDVAPGTKTGLQRKLRTSNFDVALLQRTGFRKGGRVESQLDQLRKLTGFQHELR